jgi:hypothetical protein
MPKGKIEDAYSQGMSIFIKFRPESGNIKGALNMPASPELVKSVHNRPITTELMAAIVAKKLIGKEINVPSLFGQESHKDWKKRLKKMGDWEKRDCKWSIEYIETNKDENKMPYSELFETIESIAGVEKLEELDTSAKKITLWRTKDADMIDIVKSIEKVKCIGEIKKFKKEEVK